MEFSVFKSIRCPNIRKHGEYDLCSRLLAAVKDGVIYLHCPDCKQFFALTILDNDALEMSPVDKNTRLILQTSLRLITPKAV